MTYFQRKSLSYHDVPPPVSRLESETPGNPTGPSSTKERILGERHWRYSPVLPAPLGWGAPASVCEGGRNRRQIFLASTMKGLTSPPHFLCLPFLFLPTFLLLFVCSQAWAAYTFETSGKRLLPLHSNTNSPAYILWMKCVWLCVLERKRSRSIFVTYSTFFLSPTFEINAKFVLCFFFKAVFCMWS